jgi:hypothetical protein
MAEIGKKDDTGSKEPVAELKISREYRQTQYQIAVDSKKVKKNFGSEMANAVVDIQKLWRLALFKVFLAKRIAKRKYENERRAKALRLAFAVQPVIRRYLKTLKELMDSVYGKLHPNFKPLVNKYLGGGREAGRDGKVFFKELRLDEFICPTPTLTNAHLNYDQRPRMLWNCLHWCGFSAEEAKDLVRRKIADYTLNEDDSTQPHWEIGPVECVHARELMAQREKVAQARKGWEQVRSTIVPLEEEEKGCILKEEQIKNEMHSFQVETEQLRMAQELPHRESEKRITQLEVMDFTLTQTVKLHRLKLGQIKAAYAATREARVLFDQVQKQLLVVAEESGEVQIEGRVRVLDLNDTDCPKGQGCQVTIGAEVYEGVHPTMAQAINKEQEKRKRKMQRRLERKGQNQGYDAGPERDEHGVLVQTDDYATAHLVAKPQCLPCGQRLLNRLHGQDQARATGPKECVGVECNQMLIDRCRSRYCEFPWDCWCVAGAPCSYRKVFISQYIFWKFARMVNEQLIRYDRGADFSEEWMLVHDFVEQATNAQHMTLAFLKSYKENLGKQQRKQVGRLFQQKVAREMFVSKSAQSDPFVVFAKQKAMQVKAKLWCPTEAAKEEKAAQLAKEGKLPPGALEAAGTGKDGKKNWFRWRHKRDLCYKCYSIRKNPQTKCKICDAPPRCSRTAEDMKEATGGQAKHAMLDRRNLWSAEDLHTPVAQFIVHAAVRFVAPLYSPAREKPADKVYAMAAEQTKVSGWVTQLHKSGVFTVADLAKARRADVFEFGLESLLVHRLQWPVELCDAVCRLLTMVDKQIILHHSVEGRAKEASEERYKRRLQKIEMGGVDIGRGKGNGNPLVEGYVKPGAARQLVQKQAWGDRGMNVGSARRKPPTAVRNKLAFQRAKKKEREQRKMLAQLLPSERRLHMASSKKSESNMDLSSVNTNSTNSTKSTNSTNSTRSTSSASVNDASALMGLMGASADASTVGRKSSWLTLKKSVEAEIVVKRAFKKVAKKGVEDQWHGGNAIGWLRRSSVADDACDDADVDTERGRWKEGERVEVNFYESGDWTVATVSSLGEDGRYDVIYDDHDSEKGVAAENIRALEKQEKKAKAKWRRGSLEEAHADVVAELAAAAAAGTDAGTDKAGIIQHGTKEEKTAAEAPEVHDEDEIDTAADGSENNASTWPKAKSNAKGNESVTFAEVGAVSSSVGGVGTARGRPVSASAALGGADTVAEEVLEEEISRSDGEGENKNDDSDDEQYTVVQSLLPPSDGKLMKMNWAPNVYKDALDEADAENVTNLLLKRPRSLPLRVQAEVQRQRVGSRVDPRTRLQPHMLPRGGVGGGRGMSGDGTEGRRWKDGVSAEVEMPSITRHNNGDTDATEGRMNFKRGPGPCGVPGGVERREKKRKERARKALGKKGFRAGKSLLDEDGFALPFDPVEEHNNDDDVGDAVDVDEGGEGEDGCRRVSFCFRKAEQDENQRSSSNQNHQSPPLQLQQIKTAPTHSPASPKAGGGSLFQKLALEFRELATSVRSEDILEPELVRTSQSTQLLAEKRRVARGGGSVLASGAKRRAHAKPEGMFSLCHRGFLEARPTMGASVCKQGGMGAMSISELIADTAPEGGRSIYG